MKRKIKRIVQDREKERIKVRERREEESRKIGGRKEDEALVSRGLSL